MAKTKTPAATTKNADTTEDIPKDGAVQEQAVEVAETEVALAPVAEVTEVQADLTPALEVPVPAPTPAPSLDIVPEHYEQTFDLEEYARFRRLNAAQVGLLAYVAKPYPKTIQEWDTLKKANLGG